MKQGTTRKKIAYAISAALAIQLLTWVAEGRRRLPAKVFLDDIDRYMPDEISADRMPDYLYLCDDLLRSLSSRELEQVSSLYMKLSKTRILDPSRNNDLTLPIERGSSCACTRSLFNSPLLAHVQCDDSCGISTTSYSHDHWYVYLFGCWLRLWTGPQWVS